MEIAPSLDLEVGLIINVTIAIAVVPVKSAIISVSCIYEGWRMLSHC